MNHLTKFKHGKPALICLAMLLFSPFSQANETTDGEVFKLARYYYDQENYLSTEQVLKTAVNKETDDSANSIYYHLLGKTYGRMAKQAKWLDAIKLSKKTLSAFEKAVQLDSNNVQAANDLIKYYRNAPGFLGGDDKKADKLAMKIASAENKS